MHPVHTGTFSCMRSVQQGFLVLMCEKQQRVNANLTVKSGRVMTFILDHLLSETNQFALKGGCSGQVCSTTDVLECVDV